MYRVLRGHNKCGLPERQAGYDPLILMGITLNRESDRYWVASFPKGDVIGLSNENIWIAQDIKGHPTTFCPMLSANA